MKFVKSMGRLKFCWIVQRSGLRRPHLQMIPGLGHGIQVVSKLIQKSDLIKQCCTNNFYHFNGCDLIYRLLVKIKI
jgi:hypothetical protein